MADKAIIESSMLIHRDSLYELIALANTDALEALVVSNELLQAAEDGEFLAQLLGPYLDIPDSLIDGQAISEFTPILRDRVQIYSQESAPDNPVYQNLLRRTENEWIARIVFEEWEFLTSYSWLFAKVRKALDDMVEAGSGAFYVSQGKFDHITRRLLNKSDDEPLSPNDKAKAAAKWVALGGPAVWSLFEPITGAGIGFAGSIFILSDP